MMDVPLAPCALDLDPGCLLLLHQEVGRGNFDPDQRNFLKTQKTIFFGNDSFWPDPSARFSSVYPPTLTSHIGMACPTLR
jgi:hypothetical protein